MLALDTQTGQLVQRLTYAGNGSWAVMGKEAQLGRSISAMESGPSEKKSLCLELRGRIASVDAFVGQEYVGMGVAP